MIACPIHVAILDDDPSIRSAFLRLLKGAEMIANAYATSDELFESIALKCPDCLLLDLQMPEMDGVDVLEYLGQQRIRIPTIVISGSEEEGSRSACLNAGAIGHLSKPVDAEQLIQMIKRISESSTSGMLSSAS